MKKLILEILERELMHYTIVRDRWLKDIQLNGPDEMTTTFYNEATDSIAKLKAGIKQIDGLLD